MLFMSSKSSRPNLTAASTISDLGTGPLARSSFAKSCGSIVTVQRGFCLNLSALAVVRVTAISLLPKNTEICVHRSDGPRFVYDTLIRREFLHSIVQLVVP